MAGNCLLENLFSAPIALGSLLENYNYHELIEIINLRNNFDEIIGGNYSLSKKISEINETNKLKKIITQYFILMKNKYH